jgi:hypothetical protein
MLGICPQYEVQQWLEKSWHDSCRAWRVMQLESCCTFQAGDWVLQRYHPKLPHWKCAARGNFTQIGPGRVVTAGPGDAWLYLTRLMFGTGNEYALPPALRAPDIAQSPAIRYSTVTSSRNESQSAASSGAATWTTDTPSAVTSSLASPNPASHSDAIPSAASPNAASTTEPLRALPLRRCHLRVDFQHRRQLPLLLQILFR